MDYAILSDIHGNAPALEAVLADIKRRDISKIINLGDCFFGAIQPAETAKILRKTKVITTISGNKDRDVVESTGKKELPKAMQFVLDELDDEAISFLKSLPKTYSVDGIFLASHGTPDDDNTYLTENVDAEGNVTLKSDNELILQLKNVHEPIVLCGHSHVQRLLYLSNGQIILNPGSVGLPAYIGTGSPAAIMESYTPFAKYAVVHTGTNPFTFDLISCPYNWEKSSALAKEHGNNDWAEWIKTGRALKKNKG